MATNDPKNALNYLKFGPDMYFYRFYGIPKNFLKIWKIGQFLAKKRTIFQISSQIFEKMIFHENWVSSLGNAPIELNFGMNVPWTIV